MTSRKNLTVTLTLVLGIFAINTHARSWDLAVAIGREVEFFARNRTLVGKAKLAEAVSLSGMAYDDITRTMFFSDLKNNNTSIFSSVLTDKNFTARPLVKQQGKSYILGLAFDPKTRTLFWSDTLQAAIMKMRFPLNGAPEGPTLLHDLTNRSPRGIALDLCNRHIYWTNSVNTSIERSNLDGSNRMTVIRENLYEPMAVAVDHAEGKLYWIDDREGIWTQIERSNLDGSERELRVRLKHQVPVYLSIDRDSIYWTDWLQKTILTMAKNSTAVDTTDAFRSYQMPHQDAVPGGIVTRDNIGKVDCAAIVKTRQKTSLPPTIPKVEESYNNLTTSTEESELTTETSKYCLNDGHVNDKKGSCQCKLGFTGEHCETNVCHNYCLHGTCSINNNGLPTCKCSDTFVGPRCETDLCKDYCLHDGQCSIQGGKPICTCKYFEGSRCETPSNNTDLCEKFCASEATPISASTAHCRCAEKKERIAEMVAFKEDSEFRTLLPILGALVALLVLVILVLSYYVNKYRKRPRIKKRFVVSKGGVTPLTSRPQLPDSQCEITIENCCNMNICETPCFEPKLRAATPGTNGTKKEEKNSLLDNMEENTW